MMFCQLICPVCRERLPDDLAIVPGMLSFQEEEQMLYVPSVEMRELQRRMSELFIKQKEKGGIIDLEEEKKRYLLPKVIVISEWWIEDKLFIPLL